MSRTCSRLTMKWSCTVIKTSSLWRHVFLTSSHTCDGMKKSASSACQTSTTLDIWVRASKRKNDKHIDHQASRSTTNSRPIFVAKQKYRKSENDTGAGLIMRYLIWLVCSNISWTVWTGVDDKGVQFNGQAILVQSSHHDNNPHTCSWKHI